MLSVLSSPNYNDAARPDLTQNDDGARTGKTENDSAENALVLSAWGNI